MIDLSNIILPFKIDIYDCSNSKNRKVLSGIYKITSPTGKINIGQAVDIERRLYDYKILSSRTKGQTRLYNSLKKYGVKNHTFQIIHLCKEEELNYWEDYYVKFFDTFNTPHGLNLKEGGGSKGRLSDETKKRMSESKLKIFLPYKEARDWVIENLSKKGINNLKKWHKYNELPLNIPKSPNIIYKNKGWVNWSEWFGSNFKYKGHKGYFLKYNEAKKWVSENFVNNGINTVEKWNKNKHLIPENIPKKPYYYYKNEWISWHDWFYKERNILPYEEAKKWVLINIVSKGIVTVVEWNKIKNSLPSNIPKKPYYYYKNEWISWYDWFNTTKKQHCL